MDEIETNLVLLQRDVRQVGPNQCWATGTCQQLYPKSHGKPLRDFKKEWVVILNLHHEKIMLNES